VLDGATALEAHVHQTKASESTGIAAVASAVYGRRIPHPPTLASAGIDHGPGTSIPAAKAASNMAPAPQPHWTSER